MQLPRIAARIYGTPLLLAHSKLDVILGVLGNRVGWPEPQSALPMPLVTSAPMDAPMGIAVIPIYGTLMRRAVGLEAASGLTSYGEIGAMIEAAINHQKPWLFPPFGLAFNSKAGCRTVNNPVYTKFSTTSNA